MVRSNRCSFTLLSARAMCAANAHAWLAYSTERVTVKYDLKHALQALRMIRPASNDETLIDID